MQSHELHSSSCWNKAICWLLEEKGIGSSILRVMHTVNTVVRDTDVCDVIW